MIDGIDGTYFRMQNEKRRSEGSEKGPAGRGRKVGSWSEGLEGP